MRCIDIDFKVLESRDPKILMIGDVSRDWWTAEDRPAYISITLPNSNKPRNFTFTKNQINIFNSITLGLNKFRGDCKKEVYLNLPDGLYRIELLSDFEGISKEALYLKTDLIKKKIAEKIADSYLKDKTETRGLYDRISEIDYKLTVAESFTLQGYYKEANRFFSEALKDFNCL